MHRTSRLSIPVLSILSLLFFLPRLNPTFSLAFSLVLVVCWSVYLVNRPEEFQSSRYWGMANLFVFLVILNTSGRRLDDVMAVYQISSPENIILKFSFLAIYLGTMAFLCKGKKHRLAPEKKLQV